MNHVRSIYKTDYAPYDCVENNCSSDTDEFCSTENIDDCLRYISQEFRALGYPSICSNSNSASYAVNCDIVQLLNATFELIRNSREHGNTKEDLEERNRRLYSDLSCTNKKNCQLKENLESLEKKYKGALERERQLKERNDQLLQLNKNEKDEFRKLSSQLQQQKIAYQHEVRKSESNLNQMKVRLKQLIADKNPDKKIASISQSSLLQRSSKERGKWKTGSVAKSCVDDMYSSVISSYENRCHEMLREVLDYRQCLEYIQSQILDIVSSFESEDKGRLLSSDIDTLEAVWNRPDIQNELKERFRYLLSQLKEAALQRMDDQCKKFDNEIYTMKSKICQFDKIIEDCKASGQVTLKEEGDNVVPDAFVIQREQLEEERKKLSKEKLELTATITLIEKEKANLEVQRLDVIRMATPQNSPKSLWHQNLSTLPSFSVITTKDGLTTVPTANHLKQCLSTPEQDARLSSPLWRLEHTIEGRKTQSESTLMSSSKYNTGLSPAIPHSRMEDSTTGDLPKWASSRLDSEQLSGNGTVVLDGNSAEDLEMSNISSSEELSLSRLKAAVDDIENRKAQMSK